VPDPIPADNEVIVKVLAASYNHRDLWIQKGQYAGLRYPCILGSDGCGTTNDGWEVIIDPAMEWGDQPGYQGKAFHILGLPTDGCFAEKVKVPKQNLHAKPPHLTTEQAAALPLAGATAYRATHTRGQVTQRDRVLVTGIGGGVALFALQFCLAEGSEVWVTSGSEDKIQKAMLLGAHGGMNYKNEGWSKELQASSGGFDLIIDGAAGKDFDELVNLAKPGGRIALYGGTTGDIPYLNARRIFWKQLTILGTTMATADDFRQMLDLVNKHKIVPVVDAVFPFADAEKAIRRMDGHSQFGKIVLSWSA